MYINTTTSEIVSRRQLQLMHPNTSLPVEPADIPSLGYAFINPIEPPEIPEGHELVDDKPVCIDGKWYKGYSTRPMDIGTLKSRLKDEVTALRWEKETGGISFNGVKISTTIEDQNRITTVVANARLANVDEIKFKAEDAWVTLSVADIEAIAAAVAGHVQKCFSVEYQHHTEIDKIDNIGDLMMYDINTLW